LLAPQRLAVVGVPPELERRDCGIVDLAEIVVGPRHFEPLGIGRDHAPETRLSSAVP
jgi:hypothetical protein